MKVKTETNQNKRQQKINEIQCLVNGRVPQAEILHMLCITLFNIPIIMSTNNGKNHRDNEVPLVPVHESKQVTQK